jgi:hypothetical protein
VLRGNGVLKDRKLGVGICRVVIAVNHIWIDVQINHCLGECVSHRAKYDVVESENNCNRHLGREIICLMMSKD